MGEIAENCQGVKLVLVALKCDLREKHSDEDDGGGDSTQTHSKEGKDFIDYKQGLEVARRIQALRYLGKNGHLWELEMYCGPDISHRMLGKAKSGR